MAKTDGGPFHSALSYDLTSPLRWLRCCYTPTARSRTLLYLTYTLRWLRCWYTPTALLGPYSTLCLPYDGSGGFLLPRLGLGPHLTLRLPCDGFGCSTPRLGLKPLTTYTSHWVYTSRHLGLDPEYSDGIPSVDFGGSLPSQVDPVLSRTVSPLISLAI